MVYQIHPDEFGFAKTFKLFENELQEKGLITVFEMFETTLERIFLNFARIQNSDEMEAPLPA